MKVFRYYQDFNHAGFNLGLSSGDHQYNESFWINVRMATRRLLPPVGASDVSYFEKIHRESLDYRTSERLAKEMREFF